MTVNESTNMGSLQKKSRQKQKIIGKDLGITLGCLVHHRCIGSYHLLLPQQTGVPSTWQASTRHGD